MHPAPWTRRGCRHGGSSPRRSTPPGSHAPPPKGASRASTAGHRARRRASPRGPRTPGSSCGWTRGAARLLGAALVPRRQIGATRHPRIPGNMQLSGAQLQVAVGPAAPSAVGIVGQRWLATSVPAESKAGEKGRSTRRFHLWWRSWRRHVAGRWHLAATCPALWRPQRPRWSRCCACAMSPVPSLATSRSCLGCRSCWPSSGTCCTLPLTVSGRPHALCRAVRQ
mmetsp:Transcript_6109/g.18991  ORF Transcript_6109/g.18991 Transcript_6109/m.18991 type:complete len:225 (-) Transcript_6109:683-1357(-)